MGAAGGIAGDAMTQPEPSQSRPAFRWSKAKRRAAELLAAGELSQDAIADAVGRSRRRLFEWRQHPEFQDAVERQSKELERAVFSRGIARRVRRVAAYQDRWERMRAVIDQRAVSHAMEDVPGGQTGLLAHDVKSVGSGEFAERVDLYEVDTGLLRELRELEKQCAQELGQWVEKVAPTTPGGEAEYAGLTDEQLADRILGIVGSARAARAAQGDAPGGEGAARPDGAGPAVGAVPRPPDVGV